MYIMEPTEFFLFKPITIYVTLLKIRNFWKTFETDGVIFVSVV